MYRKLRVLSILVLMLVLAACGRSESLSMEAPMEESYASDTAAYAPEGALDYGGEAEAGFRAEAELTNQTTANESLPTERLIIRTGNLSLIVTDTDATLKEITELVESNGGWVVNSNVYQYRENDRRGEITVRVPSAGFASAMDGFKAMALEVVNESTSGQDVTEEYVDLSSRLTNLEATADRVRGFLEETRNVEEALAVNQELSRLESDIEVIKGRMQYLSESASFSTITVNVTPDSVAQPIEVGGWRPEGIAKDAIEALVDALQGLANILIWLGIFVLPLLLLVIGPLYFIIRTVLRRRRARRAVAAEN